MDILQESANLIIIYLYLILLMSTLPHVFDGDVCIRLNCVVTMYSGGNGAPNLLLYGKLPISQQAMLY